ncbi:hypothetical protein PTSG_02982 [Salpingoeca rosetta]|uniref:Transmembrane protein 180 n=1 Tax=Salpingoeca rosetta (strain ATCC 50818 / BSB-021) TaxID=946362 RepID=F2U3X1_SALR5|nr:uncharacterized protein PTSG_02982 [Salpingoeca rosetta]EGD82315.1 hypothetical protein PTSG_02982 [Salpingoeca rosetta]|eukprot:XP_004996498.1 hypothetical protein PTSG_02982 [Salpingoeca rosetta]
MMGSDSNPGLGWVGKAGYGVMALALSSIHNVFLIYHVDAYVNAFGISFGGFWVAELVFLAYNSINDLIWGMIADTNVHADRQDTRGLTRRIRNTVLGGIGMAVSFFVLWFPYTTEWIAVQFCINLILYDTFLTWVELNYSALMADLTVDSKERSDLTAWRSICSLIGCASVFLSFVVWDVHDLTNFRWLATVLAAFSGTAFVLGGAVLRGVVSQSARAASSTSSFTYDEHDNIAAHISQPSSSSSSSSLSSSSSSWSVSVRRWWRDFRRLVSGHNFAWFSLLHFLQVFNCHFNSNFFPLALAVLLGDHLSPLHQSLLLGLSFTLPHINNVLFSSLVKQHGTYAVIAVLLGTKLVLSGGVAAAGLSSWILTALFIASNRIFTEGTCKLLGLVVSDLVDEDFVRNRRSNSLSAFVFGTANFLAKPGQTLAPIVGSYILASVAPGLLFRSEMSGPYAPNRNTHDTEHGQEEQDTGDTTAVSTEAKEGLFYLMTLLPLACACVQLFAWWQYKLHGSALSLMKMRAQDNSALLKQV